MDFFLILVKHSLNILMKMYVEIHFSVSSATAAVSIVNSITPRYATQNNSCRKSKNFNRGF